MNTIAENITKIRKTLTENVQLVAVSKLKSNSDIMQTYKLGQRIFGENYVQEICEKQKQLPKDIEWHFIGHLQTNKVKCIIPFIKCIHGIDSLKLLKEVNRQAEKHKKIIKCLLQFHIASEESKFGFSYDEAEEMLKSKDFSELKNVEICGVMGMASFTKNNTQIRNEFRNLAKYYKNLKENYFSNQQSFKEISMGMTDDYLIAIEEGSTMVRIGSGIFGPRNYNKK